MRAKIWLALCLVPALMASTCIYPVRVGVTPGAQPGDAPAFDFAYRGDPLTYVEEFQVADCRHPRTRSIVWRIERDGQTPPDPGPLRLTYGRVPRGYRETQAPRPLAPGGCYDASAYALRPIGSAMGNPTGHETFRLLPNGRTIIGSPAGLANNNRPYRHLNRAAVGCTRGYRRAATAADSAAVDAREYTVLDARVTCGWLFTQWPDVVEGPASTEQAALALAALAAVFAGIFVLEDVLPDIPD